MGKENKRKEKKRLFQQGVNLWKKRMQENEANRKLRKQKERLDSFLKGERCVYKPFKKENNIWTRFKILEATGQHYKMEKRNVCKVQGVPKDKTPEAKKIAASKSLLVESHTTATVRMTKEQIETRLDTLWAEMGIKMFSTKKMKPIFPHGHESFIRCKF